MGLFAGQGPFYPPKTPYDTCCSTSALICVNIVMDYKTSYIYMTTSSY